MTPKQRAQIVANWLINENADKLGSRQCDYYFEQFDGEKVVREIITILAAKGIHSFEQLPKRSQRYAGRDWWTNPEYKAPDPETVLGLSLF